MPGIQRGRPQIAQESLDRLYAIREDWLMGRQRYDAVWRENANRSNRLPDSCSAPT